ncbi:MAG TPA: hypothetical protein VGV57_11695 [Thermoleophilaceae bacterium]|nr:hypothetical protein [Thermoleophilaceae bacterium]
MRQGFSGQKAQGLNVLHFNEAGTIRDLTVFFRPLASLNLIAEVIGAWMAERFGPPPEWMRGRSSKAKRSTISGSKKRSQGRGLS